MAERERPSSLAEASGGRVRIAVGTPQVVIDILCSAPENNTFINLTPEEHVAIKIYFGQKQIRHRKFERNFSLADIDDLDKRMQFKELVRSGLVSLTPGPLRGELPKTDDWFLKRIDSSRKAQATRKLWDENLEFRKAARSTQTPEANRKKSEAQKKRWADPEIRAKNVAAIRKATQTDEHRQKIGKVVKKRWEEADPETRERILSRLKKAQKGGRTHTPEEKAQIGSTLKKRWEDPEYKARRAAEFRKRAEDPEYRKRMSEAVKKAKALRKAEQKKIRN